MRDITVQNVANPHSRVRRDFASGAVRLVQLLPLQLRPLEVAQPFPHAVGGELNAIGNLKRLILQKSIWPFFAFSLDARSF